MTMPGFSAESSLVPTMERYRVKAVRGTFFLDGSGPITPQFRFSATWDPDLGAYLRCIANGGNELVCRFFGGLPPFTIGGRLINR
jgi:hypothetical protein